MDNPKNLLKALTSARIDYLFYALLCIVFYWIFETFVLQSICSKLSKKIDVVTCFRTTMVGQLFNCITPLASGGQPMQAVVLNQNNIPIGQASCILLAKFIVYQTTLTIYSFVLIFLKLEYFLKHVSGFGLLVLVGFAVHILVVVLLIGVGFFPKTTRKFLIKLTHILHKLKFVKDISKMTDKINHELDEFYHNFSIIKKDLKLLILPTIITVLQLTAFFVIPYFVCLSLGIKGDLLTIICASAFVLMITSFIPLPGGSGGAEGGFYFFFQIFFPKAALLAIAIILWRIFTFYLPIMIGILFTKLYYKPKGKNLSLE